MDAGGAHHQEMQTRLKAVAALRNCSLDLYYVSPTCSEDHPTIWQTQLKKVGLLPFENAVHDLHSGNLLKALETLKVPACVQKCGCNGFTPALPRSLIDVVRKSLLDAHHTIPSMRDSPGRADA